MGSITLKPVLGCNLACTGCYESSVLNRNVQRPDIEAIIDRMAALAPGGDVVLHGGEVTLLRIDEAERLCQAAHDQGREIVMQTNGTLLTEPWHDLIERFQIGVGVSINGPLDLNRSRWAGTIEATDRMTARAQHAAERLAETGRLSSIIVTLMNSNCGTDEQLERLIAWAGELGERHNILSFKMNLLFDPDSALELTPERAAEVYVRLLEATVSDPRRMWLPFRQMIDNLCGLGLQGCSLAPCDPYQTEAVNTIFGDGSRGSCLRMSPNGVPWQRAEGPMNYVRQEILYQIPVEQGGCGGCRFWNMCHGGCTAEGEGGDWRNKTRFCKATYDVYQAIERKLGGWLPNWRPVTTWSPPDPAATAQSIDARRPKYSSFAKMLANATYASTYAWMTTAANDW